MNISAVSFNQKSSTFGTLKIMPSAKKILLGNIDKGLLSASHLREARTATSKLNAGYTIDFINTIETYFSKFTQGKMILRGTKFGDLRFSLEPAINLNLEKQSNYNKILLMSSEEPKINQCTLSNIQDIAAEYHQIMKEKSTGLDLLRFDKIFKFANADINQKGAYTKNARRFWC